jgi:hypothetical protein
VLVHCQCRRRAKREDADDGRDGLEVGHRSPESMVLTGL